ncbi:MAG: type II toxin-antitoxin system RelE/ParE family toxin [Gammaproteobacteria bacterium]|jgi:mRNA interferase RelE/StbE
MCDYNIKIHKQAKKKLQSLNAKDRLKITDKIMELSYNPDSANLDTKVLTNSSLWRLRIGKWRVIYSRDDIVKILRIEKIKSRGDVYK